MMHCATEYDVVNDLRRHLRTTFQGDAGPEYYEENDDDDDAAAAAQAKM